MLSPCPSCSPPITTSSNATIPSNEPKLGETLRQTTLFENLARKHSDALIERVEELDRMLLMKTNDWIDACKDIDSLTTENEKMRKVIEYYADQSHCELHDHNMARECLAGLDKKDEK